MGNLVIKRLLYSGDKYYFNSPEFENGINIILGDNGSGKSTFSYFIEYGLGGYVPVFNSTNKEKYKEIIEDTNNYVQIYLLIDDVEYSLKRFIGHNDIFIENNGKHEQLPINRNRGSRIFSDWLLEKLSIMPFELTLGSYNWILNFHDIFRLLNYDQDTEPRKIFKTPAKDNFITDSLIIRKVIFETLIGLSSQSYNESLSAFKKSQSEKDESKSILNSFIERYPEILKYNDLKTEENDLSEFNTQIEKLLENRTKYQLSSVSTDDKMLHLADMQSELISLEIEISNNTILKHKLTVEQGKIEQILLGLNEEIEQIIKIIHTHDKLNLFSLEKCPFCGKINNHKIGECICGEVNTNEDYERFVYKSSEYKTILDHKKKRIQTIEAANNSYKEDIAKCVNIISSNTIKADKIKTNLIQIINSIEYSGNSQLIDNLNDKILSVREQIQDTENRISLIKEYNLLSEKYEENKALYEGILDSFKSVESDFIINNKRTIEAFNTIFSSLMKESSCNANSAEIDDDYMPVINSGFYKEKSSIVPIRLMYYFTLFGMGMSYKQVRHPHFLLIDTPEEAGIDTPNLKHNLGLFTMALELAKKGRVDVVENYQVILTTGYDKYPDEWKDMIRIKFSTEDSNYILKPRNNL